MLKFVWFLVVAGLLGGCSLVGVPPKVDGDARAEYADLVGRAFADLDALPDYPGLEATPADVSECGYDSGELFDDAGYKTWEETEPENEPVGVAGWVKAVPDIERRLVDMGWRDVGGGEFVKRFGGESISIWIAADPISPSFISIHPDGWDRHVCETWGGTPAS